VENDGSYWIDGKFHVERPQCALASVLPARRTPHLLLRQRRGM
jgi:hypothetical protein